MLIKTEAIVSTSGNSILATETGEEADTGRDTVGTPDMVL